MKNGMMSSQGRGLFRLLKRVLLVAGMAEPMPTDAQTGPFLQVSVGFGIVGNRLDDSGVLQARQTGGIGNVLIRSGSAGSAFLECTRQFAVRPGDSTQFLAIGLHLSAQRQRILLQELIPISRESELCGYLGGQMAVSLRYQVRVWEKYSPIGWIADFGFLAGVAAGKHSTVNKEATTVYGILDVRDQAASAWLAADARMGVSLGSRWPAVGMRISPAWYIRKERLRIQMRPDAIHKEGAWRMGEFFLTGWIAWTFPVQSD